ncbi:MAG: winged helix-turn-helix transcriptional regulator, partial [Elusimicrobia bacterium]|nr:winged helix-turn-helix transcriptional regulator [Elusimicrobiota bacterium]
PKTTPKTEAEILALIAVNPSLTKADLAKELNLTVDGIKYSIKKLTKKGALRWSGPSKTGQWALNSQIIKSVQRHRRSL